MRAVVNGGSKGSKERMANEYLTFLKELPKSFSQIGAMVPSSPALARLMVRPIKEAYGPLNILEVGPGTGPFTRRIIRLMGPQDKFTICEINSRFLALLKDKLERLPEYKRNQKQISFFEGPVQDLGRNFTQPRFDVIISSLPFSNFSPELVADILDLYRRLLKPDGTLSFFEYVGLRKISAAFSKRDVRDRLEKVDCVINNWFEQIEADHGVVEKEVSLLNLPPACAIRLNLAPAYAAVEVEERAAYRLAK